jgi:hypothetical protein
LHRIPSKVPNVLYEENFPQIFAVSGDDKITLEDGSARVEDREQNKLQMRVKDKRFEENVWQILISCYSPYEGAMAFHDSLTLWLAYWNDKY